MPRLRPASAVIACLLIATGGVVAQQLQQQYDWQLPPGFPAPNVPADNPMTAEKVLLGRHLFYEPRLSKYGTQSCAACHRRELAFTDGLGRAVGSTGEVHPRGSMSLVNVAYASTLTWSDPNLTHLEDQALTPMYGDQPVELGLDRSDDWLVMFERDELYADLFREAFPGSEAPITRQNVVKAIASFERSIISARAPYDRYRMSGDESAISPAAKRGETLFQSQSLGCVSCHGGFNFSAPVVTDRTPKRTADLHSITFLNLPTVLSAGARSFTTYTTSIGQFKAPTLRNIALTAPYMHDGSIATLDAAVAHYRTGGTPLTLSDDDRRDLVAFLESLTDRALILDTRFDNPWRKLLPSRSAPW